MPDYRRAYQPGGSFFFTVVTYRRQPFLCDPAARRSLRDAIDVCRDRMPFTIDAFVLLPDHLHTIWTLPPGDADFPRRWAIVKRTFTVAWRLRGGWEGDVSDSRRRNRRAGVWQRRFWEHVLRDEVDLEQHLDYIHYNPVKHGYATCPHAWPFSSFHRLTAEGVYAPTWCCSCDGRTAAPANSGLVGQEEIEMPFGE